MDVHSDHSEDESTAPGSSNGDSVYLTPSVSGMEIDNKLTQSAFEVIESDDVKSEVLLDDLKSTDQKNDEKTEPKIVSLNDDSESGDSESTDDSVNTSELPELIEIENPDEPKPQENEPEANDDTPTVPEWEDILGTGRLHIKRISAGSG